PCGWRRRTSASRSAWWSKNSGWACSQSATWESSNGRRADAWAAASGEPSHNPRCTAPGAAAASADGSPDTATSGDSGRATGMAGLIWTVSSCWKLWPLGYFDLRGEDGSRGTGHHDRLAGLPMDGKTPTPGLDLDRRVEQ